MIREAYEMGVEEALEKIAVSTQWISKKVNNSIGKRYSDLYYGGHKNRAISYLADSMNLIRDYGTLTNPAMHKVIEPGKERYLQLPEQAKDYYRTLIGELHRLQGTPIYKKNPSPNTVLPSSLVKRTKFSPSKSKKLNYSKRQGILPDQKIQILEEERKKYLEALKRK